MVVNVPAGSGRTIRLLACLLPFLLGAAAVVVSWFGDLHRIARVSTLLRLTVIMLIELILYLIISAIIGGIATI